MRDGVSDKFTAVDTLVGTIFASNNYSLGANLPQCSLFPESGILQLSGLGSEIKEGSLVLRVWSVVIERDLFFFVKEESAM